MKSFVQVGSTGKTEPSERSFSVVLWPSCPPSDTVHACIVSTMRHPPDSRCAPRGSFFPQVHSATTKHKMRAPERAVGELLANRLIRFSGRRRAAGCRMPCGICTRSCVFRRIDARGDIRLPKPTQRSLLSSRRTSPGDCNGRGHVFHFRSQAKEGGPLGLVGSMWMGHWAKVRRHSRYGKVTRLQVVTRSASSSRDNLGWRRTTRIVETMHA